MYGKNGNLNDVMNITSYSSFQNIFRTPHLLPVDE